MIWEIGGGKRMIKEYITTYDPARGGAYLRNIGGLTKKEVKKIANDYIWPYGKKIIKTHEQNLGLRNHMMSLGEWFEQFDTLVILEDDIIVSQCFYSYVRQASDKYMNNSDVC